MNNISFILNLESFIQDSEPEHAPYEVAAILAAAYKNEAFDILWFLDLFLPQSLNKERFFEVFSLYCGMGFFVIPDNISDDVLDNYLSTTFFTGGVLEKEGETEYYQSSCLLVEKIAESLDLPEAAL